MKLKKRILLVISAVLAAVVLLCTLTEEGALRAAVFFASPKNAFTMEFEVAATPAKKETIYKITENEPVEKETDGSLYTWKVTKFGLFCYAEYYGEGLY